MDKRVDASSIGKELTVGEVGRRSGVSASAIRFYEAKGLIKSNRNPGNQRRFPREVLRRIAVIKVAQRLGVPLVKIRDALQTLPDSRTPNAADWGRLSVAWKAELTQRIDVLTRLRDSLTDCIGCGCLSLNSCPLRNPWDRLASQGSGPRLLDPVDDARR
jgi:MerR family redox-sensitive transcriptional activator SoxR